MSKRKREEHSNSLQNDRIISEGTEEEDDDLQIVNAPTPSNQFIELQIALLLQKSTVSTILDTFLAMQLDREENWTKRDAFQNTDICKNLIVVLSTTNDNKKDQQDIIVKALMFTVDLTFCNRNLQREFIRNKALTAINKMMASSLQNETLQLAGCMAMYHILSSLENNYNSIDDDINTNDILKILVDNMKKYPQNLMLQLNIMGCLYKFSCGNNNNAMIQKLVRMQFVEYALKNVLLSMDYNFCYHRFNHTTYSAFFCGFLMNLSKVEEAKACICNNDGIRILANIENLYRKQSDHHEIADFALNLIFTLST